MQNRSWGLVSGAGGKIGRQGGDGAPPALQNEDWISVEFFIDVCVPFPSHYSPGEKLPQAHQGKQIGVNQDFIAKGHVITWNFFMGQHG